MTHSVSALGDTALLFPVSLVFLGYLVLIRRVRLAGHLALALALGLGATLAAKFAFSACGSPMPDVDLTSPSGHAAFAALVYGALAYAFAIGRPAWVGLALGLAAAGLVGAVGLSRILLGYHSGAEVVAGIAIGCAALALFGWLRWPLHERPLTPIPLLAGLFLAASLFLGRSLTFEHQIARTARHVTGMLDICSPQAGLTDLRRHRL